MAGFIDVLLRARVHAIIRGCCAARKRCAASRPGHGLHQLLNVPLRSLKRSSGWSARTLGVCTESGRTEAAPATEVALATEVSDEELPHNSRTAGETG